MGLSVRPGPEGPPWTCSGGEAGGGLSSAPSRAPSAVHGLLARGTKDRVSLSLPKRPALDPRDETIRGATALPRSPDGRTVGRLARRLDSRRGRIPRSAGGPTGTPPGG